MKAFKLRSDGLEPAGTVAYLYGGYDYGLASDDTDVTGRKHVSLTKKAYGGGPFFTHAKDDLEEMEVDDLPVVDDEHTMKVCKIGQGAACCRYLTMSPSGWSCEKLSMAGTVIDRRVEKMTAQADNCEGRAALG